MKKVNYNGTILTLTDNIEKAMKSMEKSNYYEALNYLRYESSNILVEGIRKGASTQLLNEIIQNINSNNLDTALSQLNRLRNQNGVPYDISKEFTNIENKIKEMKIVPKINDIVNDANNKRFENALYKLNNLKREGYPSSVSSQINDLENKITESYHSYLLQEIIELNDQEKYEQALRKIKIYRNISYNMNNRINENKKIIKI